MNYIYSINYYQNILKIIAIEDMTFANKLIDDHIDANYNTVYYNSESYENMIAWVNAVGGFDMGSKLNNQMIETLMIPITKKDSLAYNLKGTTLKDLFEADTYKKHLLVL